MGKNLKGKELGKGLYQRKDGLYSARFLSKTGTRTEKYFHTIPEARNWLSSAKYEDENGTLNPESGLTFDEWFNYWVDNFINDLAPNTIRNYKERYRFNINPYIGKMKMTDINPIHCKKILNAMSDVYSGSTIKQTYITLGTVFKAALMNDIIYKHPMNGVFFTKPVRAASDIKFLTIDEQKRFLEVAKRSHNYRQYALLLETGLRTGEMIGLTWDAVDLKNRTLTVNKTLEYRHNTGEWRAGPPKTQSSYRTIPLTRKAYEILKELYDEYLDREDSYELSRELTYLDRISGERKTLIMKDLVFINYRTGMPAKNSSYDTHLYKLCKEAGIKKFCMHALRHTYATRAIERGIQPNVLQKLLGHASIKTTMDRYVHVTNESMLKAIRLFEENEDQ